MSNIISMSYYRSKKKREQSSLLRLEKSRNQKIEDALAKFGSYKGTETKKKKTAWLKQADYEPLD